MKMIGGHTPGAYPTEPRADDLFSQKAYQTYRDMTIVDFGNKLNNLTPQQRTALANKFSWMILPLEEAVDWNRRWAGKNAEASIEKADDMEKKRELLQMKLDAVNKRINDGHNKWNDINPEARNWWNKLIWRDEELRKPQGGKRRSKSSNKPKKSAKRVKTAKRSKSRKIRRQRK